MLGGGQEASLGFLKACPFPVPGSASSLIFGCVKSPQSPHLEGPHWTPQPGSGEQSCEWWAGSQAGLAELSCRRRESPGGPETGWRRQLSGRPGKQGQTVCYRRRSWRCLAPPHLASGREDAPVVVGMGALTPHQEASRSPSQSASDPAAARVHAALHRVLSCTSARNGPCGQNPTQGAEAVKTLFCPFFH